LRPWSFQAIVIPSDILLHKSPIAIKIFYDRDSSFLGGPTRNSELFTQPSAKSFNLLAEAHAGPPIPLLSFSPRPLIILFRHSLPPPRINAKALTTLDPRQQNKSGSPGIFQCLIWRSFACMILITQMGRLPPCFLYFTLAIPCLLVYLAKPYYRLPRGVPRISPLELEIFVGGVLTWSKKFPTSRYPGRPRLGESVRHSE